MGHIYWQGAIVTALALTLGVSAHPAHGAPAGHIEEKIGFMAHQDYVRYSDIETAAHRSGRISDADLDWLLQLMVKRPPIPNDVNEDIVHDDVMIVFREVKSPPPAQERKMYRAVSPLLSSGRWRQRAVAARVVGILGDQRAVSALRRLRDDPSPAVRAAAGRALSSLRVS